MKYNDKRQVTVVEFSEFTRFAEKHLKPDEYENLVSYLALEPEAGVVIAGTGGIRKLRWAAKGKGKSGGTRVIYFYHNPDMPLFLLTGFAKNQVENISPAARKAYRKLVKELVKAYEGRNDS